MGDWSIHRSNGSARNSVVSLHGGNGASRVDAAGDLLSGGDARGRGTDSGINRIISINAAGATTAGSLDDFSLRRAACDMARPIWRWGTAAACLYLVGSIAGYFGGYWTHLGDYRNGTEMEALTVSLVTAAISFATFIYALLANKTKATIDNVEKLERKLENVETRLQECEDDRFALRREILALQTAVTIGRNE